MGLDLPRAFTQPHCIHPHRPPGGGPRSQRHHCQHTPTPRPPPPHNVLRAFNLDPREAAVASGWQISELQQQQLVARV